MRDVTPIRPGRLLLNDLAKGMTAMAGMARKSPKYKWAMRATRFFTLLCNRAQPFLLPLNGDFGLSGARSISIGEARPPYPGTALEFVKNDGGAIVIFLVDDIGKGVMVAAAHSDPECHGGWNFYRNVALIKPNTIISMREDGYEYSIDPEVIYWLGDPGMSVDDARKSSLSGTFLQIAGDFLCLLSCANVVIKDAPVSRASLERSQASHKGGRFLTYKVLDLPDSGTQWHGGASGGAHASPRFHYRRGHIRRLASGRNTWVRMCAVGKASNGIVLKDYDAAGLSCNVPM